MTGDPGFPWEEWGAAAFDRARAEKKPVLLHIGATWCHWCHVMDEGSYTWPGVAELVRKHFVAVRVDTDLRPDINERYNQGGWPTFAVLDAEGEVLFGRTYVPGHELCAMLAGLAESDAKWSVAPARPEAAAGPPAAVEDVWAEVKKAYDTWHGGFGDFQKFPHTAVCGWILDRRLRGADDGGMLEKTLDGMAFGELVDAEEGGFFRYTTQDDWTVPHYEKLLEDNARLVALYLRADAAGGRPGWREVAEGAVAWALRVLWQEGDQAFGGSQDADEEYYARGLALRGDPPQVDRTVYAGWNGGMVATLVRAGAAWDRPGLVGVARRVGTTLLGRMDAEGRVTRAGAVAGLLEDQAQVAEGWIALAQATGDPVWLAAAGRALGWAWDHLHAPGGGLTDRVPEGIGRLRIARRPLFGNATFAEVAHRLGALTGEPAWSARAVEAADAALVEGAGWAFMAAAAAGAREAVARTPVVVKIRANPKLLASVLADPHSDVLAWPVVSEDVPDGTAMACSGTACARPTGDVAELARAIAMLRRA